MVSKLTINAANYPLPPNTTESMKKGINLNVKGFSSRGTLTVDTYTLKGFSSAFNTLSKGC